MFSLRNADCPQSCICIWTLKGLFLSIMASLSKLAFRFQFKSDSQVSTYLDLYHSFTYRQFKMILDCDYNIGFPGWLIGVLFGATKEWAADCAVCKIYAWNKYNLQKGFSFTYRRNENLLSWADDAFEAMLNLSHPIASFEARDLWNSHKISRDCTFQKNQA